MASLKGKVALVTGASSGIGEAIACLLAERGAKVALCGRDHDRLKAASDKCKKASGHQDRFIALSGDLNRPEVRKKLVEETVKRFGRLDILVANAGVLVCNGGVEKETEENFDLQFNTNVKSVYFLIQQAVPELEKVKGNIVVISSYTSEICSGPFAIYCASKAAVDHLVRCMCLELGKKDIRINTVNPTFVPETRVFYNLFPGSDDKDQSTRELLASKDEFHPLQGRCGTLDDMAKTVAFLVSGEAGFITGQNLSVDGGTSRNYAILPA